MTTDHTTPAPIVEPGIERGLDLNHAPDLELGFEAAAEHIFLLKANPECVEHISSDLRPARSSLSKSQTGYIAIFTVVSLELVERRFGMGGLHELRRTIQRCLLQNLQPEDCVYDLAQHMFVAVCDRRAHPARQEQLTAELCRVLARNRDFPIQVGERKIMLRIPISVVIHPISQLGSPCQLRELLRNPKSLEISPSTDGNDMPGLAVIPGQVSVQNTTGAGA
jgi:hypothetical protein